MRITLLFRRLWGQSTMLGSCPLSIRISSSLAVLFSCTIRYFVYGLCGYGFKIVKPGSRNWGFFFSYLKAGDSVEGCVDD